MDGCIFCKIVAGEIPAQKVYEDEGYIAFLDIFPRNPGHVQVIPKKHYRWVWDDSTIGRYMEAAQKVVQAQKKALGTDWVVATIVGEDVEHAHIWLIPRFANDAHGEFLTLTEVKQIPAEEMVTIADKIRSALI